MLGFRVHGLPVQRFQALLTLFSKSFSSFPHGTCLREGLGFALDLYPGELRHRIYNILEYGCCLGPPLMIIERRGVAAFPLSPEAPKPPKPLGPQEFEQGSGFCYTVVISWEECYYCSSDLYNYVCPKLKVSCSVAKSRMNQSYSGFRGFRSRLEEL